MYKGGLFVVCFVVTSQAAGSVEFYVVDAATLLMEAGRFVTHAAEA